MKWQVVETAYYHFLLMVNGVGDGGKTRSLLDHNMLVPVGPYSGFQLSFSVAIFTALYTVFYGY